MGRSGEAPHAAWRATWKACEQTEIPSQTSCFDGYVDHAKDDDADDKEKDYHASPKTDIA